MFSRVNAVICGLLTWLGGFQTKHLFVIGKIQGQFTLRSGSAILRSKRSFIIDLRRAWLLQVCLVGILSGMLLLVYACLGSFRLLIRGHQLYTALIGSAAQWKSVLRGGLEVFNLPFLSEVAGVGYGGYSVAFGST